MQSMLAKLIQAEAPFVSAYLESPSNEPNAAFHLTTRWKTLRSQLAEDGVDTETLEAMDAAIGVDTEAVTAEPRPASDNQPEAEVDAAAEHRAGEVLGVIAANGQVLMCEGLPAVAATDQYRLGPVPWVTPLIEAEQASVPYVLVLADRTGADLHGFSNRTEIDTTVEGSENQIERNAPGGWSQKRYQQRAIDSWEKNAREVADAAVGLADRLSARLILIGGDEHAVSPFLDALPKQWAERAKVLEHATRAAGGNDELRDEEIERLLKTARAEDEVALLERFREQRGRGEKAADGAAAVVAQLQMAMVDTLLVHDDPEDERIAWVGPDPTHLSLDRSELEGMGVDAPTEGRLIDVAVRAALGTGAEVRLVPGPTITEGLAALLRG